MWFPPFGPTANAWSDEGWPLPGQDAAVIIAA
jgi:hypothetical protein